jgi:pimeloyl-ACP methyl ester carboxylesterase
MLPECAQPPLRHVLPVNGLDLAAWEWPGEGMPILLLHATGFHARCWRVVAQALAGRHVIALDMPSHGASGNKPPPYDWEHFGDDVHAAVDALGLGRLVGVGHSMGGHALVRAAAQQPGRYAGLLLIDPVIVDPAIARRFAGAVPADQHPVARRRNRWDSPQQMFEAFSVREPYSRWQPEVLHDYCRYGLVRNADDSAWELACPPDLEAEIYAGMGMGNIFELIAHLGMPVEIIRARSRRPDESLLDFSPSPTWERLADFFPDAHDEQLPDCSHFIPMERPVWTAARIAQLADRVARSD